jgi:hypothetical protein
MLLIRSQNRGTSRSGLIDANDRPHVLDTSSENIPQSLNNKQCI